MNLQNNDSLERSSIVANSRMNRERKAIGVNSYEKELLFSPIDFLVNRIENGKPAAWLDLCCGRGRALLEASNAITDLSFADRSSFHGIDLVGMFDPIPSEANPVTLEVASLHSWNTTTKYDLITCIHGLHYIGDKLSLIARAASWLKDDGKFFASLDLANFQSTNGTPISNLIAKQFCEAGLDYNSKRHLLSCDGAKTPLFNFRYFGADDTAGPNYSKQEVVNSVYEVGE